MRKKENGFTLIELMVTIAVLAIIAMMAAPSMTNMIRKNQLQGDAREVVELAIMARSNAIFSKKEQKLALDTSVTDGQLWTPKHTSWATKPVNSLTYNMFGFLVSANDRECFILQHQKDNSQKAVIEFFKNGSVRYERSNSTCPN
ncbi:MAG: prepilin-type N-terminal cleavage/methylation domain-containing protein [Acinetobacter sp.]|uniref:pilus assembly FimT family protein n=1 Tax=Acinetobacter sp. TaxID=472 RepID=UPI0026E0212E|nr:prepilin-type N-terminal cleavage/methylation domain-containing protein [Acinetobacter sp.]MDO5543704.1 prepilin-type N-terminal cleavage/methylation domain-containing protein [Acinetobacter sp.]